jgi:putative methionine-R-sulfoxide reductase with GAF domain
MHSTPDFNYHDTAAEVVILREKNSLLNVLSDYATALLNMTTTDDVLRYTSSEVVGRMGFNDCVIYLWDNVQERLIQCSAFGHKSTEHGAINNVLALKLGEGLVGRAAQLRQPIIVNDLSQDSDYVLDVQQAASELAIPIIHLNELIGVIDSENEEIGFYTEDRVKLLTTVTSMLSAKLAQTKLITQLETSITQLEYAEKLQKVLFKIAELTYEDDNFFKVYDKIHSLISELFYAKSFFVAVYNEESSQIEFPYFVDESLPDLAAHIGPTDSKMEGLSAWVIFNNTSLLLSKADIIERAKGKEFKVLGNIAESWLGVPIHAGEDLKGALVVQSYSPNISYVEKDRDLLSFVSSHVCSLTRCLNRFG